MSRQSLVVGRQSAVISESVAVASRASRGELTEAIADRTIARVRRRLIPFLAVLYLVAYLDRVNVGFAALQMNAALGLSPLDYGRGAGIFFLGYFLFEVPSNLALARIGARIWIARIAIVWGIVSVSTLFAVGAAQLQHVSLSARRRRGRVLPGHRVLLHLLVSGRRAGARGRAVFMIASMAAGIIGAPLSGALLSLRGVGGLDGWQWLFLIEGLPAIVLGLIALAYLDDGPVAARWLPDDEKVWLLAALKQEHDEDVAAASEHGARGPARPRRVAAGVRALPDRDERLRIQLLPAADRQDGSQADRIW